MTPSSGRIGFEALRTLFRARPSGEGGDAFGTPRRDSPAAALDLDRFEFGGELRLLRWSSVFWAGLALKLVCAVLFGSHVATRWFAPFVYSFVHSHFANPWDIAMQAGEPLAFPYGPGMLLLLAPAWLPAAVTSFEPASHLGLFLLRLPLLAADLAILLVLMRWLRTHAREVIVAYWLNPVVWYATYVHGQLDLLPTALLAASLYVLVRGRLAIAGSLFGVALATKAHLLVAFPLALVYAYRVHRRPAAWLRFGGLAALTAALLYLGPLPSAAFREMVLGSAESKKLFAVTLAYGTGGMSLYLAPALIGVAFLRFASFRKVNRELTMMFIGALYVALVALVPPQPGWFIWSMPFVAYLAALYSRVSRFVLPALCAAYLVHFFVEDPALFLGALDPTLGPGFGERAASALHEAAPALGGAHLRNLGWTALFATTSITAYEMYQRGVRSNSIYRYRDATFMIGVGGDSGAGKHTIGRDLALLVGDRIALLNGDDDHKWERGHAMWRRYTHLDPRGNRLGAQLESLTSLRHGREIRKRHYDHDNGRFTSPLRIQPKDFVAIIGLHPFYLASQREVLDLKVFVDPDEDLRRERKIVRDMASRGYTREQVVEQIEKRMPDSQKYVRPQMKHADVVVRQLAQADDPDAVVMEFELTNDLDPLALVEAFDELPALKVEWSPDDALTRERIRVEGKLDAAQVQALAQVVIPNLEELASGPKFLGGGRGLQQLVVLHAVSARLRNAPRGAANEVNA